MSKLPFGSNPFADAPTANTVVERARPTASALPNLDPLTLPSQVIDKQDKLRKKRDGVANQSRDPAQKRPRITEETPVDPVASTFGSLARDNYSGEDLKLWTGRTKSEAEYSFRQGLGVVFFHGLNVLAAKNSQISDLDKSVKKYRDSALSLKGQVKELQKQADDELKAKQREVDDLQAALDKISLEAKQAEEDHSNAIANLQMEIEGLKAGQRKELSDAYSQGFLGYLRAFMAGDPDYDWAMHFAPSTPAYMTKFRADNAEVIAEEKARLEAKIASELAKAAADEGAKLEEANPANEGENVDKEASPSRTVVS